MKVGILGSGFGLYGYLPAVAGLADTVVLPRRYQATLEAREDVGRFAKDVDWARDDEEVLGRCDALIVGRRPADQVELVRRALSTYPAIDRFLLEKPLAPDPRQARQLLVDLREAGKHTRVGFTFRYTPWAERVRGWLSAADPAKPLSIDWRFNAHHYRTQLETWKRRPSQGGGVVRFYAIHLIALLAELGYRDVEWSTIRSSEEDDDERWQARLRGPGLPPCGLTVDSKAAETRFSVMAESKPGSAAFAVSLGDPFDEAPASALDRRVDVLTGLCREFAQAAPPKLPDWYTRSVDLWAAIEATTVRNS
ncbi:putative dehydrogenase [Amorphus suaedae]